MRGSPATIDALAELEAEGEDWEVDPAEALGDSEPAIVSAHMDLTTAKHRPVPAIPMSGEGFCPRQPGAATAP